MRSGEAVLDAIADAARPAIPVRVAIVLAHPDDETLGCGALLPRLRDATIIHVTDGAPREGSDAARRGYAAPGAYAAARRTELEQAVALAGIGPERLLCLGVPDQGAAFALADIARRLLPLMAGAELVLTHAFEGGHPDHDATAFAVHAAVRLLGEGAPAVVEMPLYRAGPNGTWLRQSFAGEETEPPRVLAPTEDERELKSRMMAAHASQTDTLAAFGPADEPYRQAPHPDFGQLPNGGDLLYERYGWGLTGTRWLELAEAATRELAPGRRP